MLTPRRVGLSLNPARPRCAPVRVHARRNARCVHRDQWRSGGLLLPPSKPREAMRLRVSPVFLGPPPPKTICIKWRLAIAQFTTPAVQTRSRPGGWESSPGGLPGGKQFAWSAFILPQKEQAAPLAEANRFQSTVRLPLNATRREKSWVGLRLPEHHPRSESSCRLIEA